jgi:transcriptional regulator with XRE-family HTH domain
MFIMVLGSGMEDEMDIKNRIKDLRIIHNMSQEQLAEKVGTTKQAISQYERGIRKPKYEILEAIADYFNVDYDYLIGKTPKTTFLPQMLTLQLSKKEFRILEAYRNADKDTKKIVRMLLKIDGGES